METAGLPPPLINQIKRLAAFQNPEFYKKQTMRLSNALTPRLISCAEEHPRHVGLPRGCTEELQALFAELGVALEVDDQRTAGESLDVRFQGELSPIQEQAVRAMTEHDLGVFVAPPGSGKTVVGANLVACRACSTLDCCRFPRLGQVETGGLRRIANPAPPPARTKLSETDKGTGCPSAVATERR